MSQKNNDNKQRLTAQIPSESVERQIGRSDFLLGEPKSINPFPKGGKDHKEWKIGWKAQQQSEYSRYQHLDLKLFKHSYSPSSASA